MGLAKSEAPARVILQNEEKKLSGSQDVSTGAPVQFLATLNTGATYEFVSEPVAPVIKDMIESEKEGFITLTAEEPRPLKMESEIIPGHEYGRITKLFRFQDSITKIKIYGGGTSLKKRRI